MNDHQQELGVRHHHQLVLLRPDPQQLRLVVSSIQLFDHTASASDEVPNQLRNGVGIACAPPLRLAIGAVGVCAVRCRCGTLRRDLLGREQSRRAYNRAGVAGDDERALDAGALGQACEETLRLGRGKRLLHRV